jgi:hypothetical protein
MGMHSRRFLSISGVTGYVSFQGKEVHFPSIFSVHNRNVNNASKRMRFSLSVQNIS